MGLRSGDDVRKREAGKGKYMENRKNLKDRGTLG